MTLPRLPRHVPTALALVLLLALAPAGVAQVARDGYAAPCPTAPCAPNAEGSVGNVTFAASLRFENATDPNVVQYVVSPGESGSAYFRFAPASSDANATAASVNVTVGEAPGVEWLDAREATFVVSAPRDAAFAFRIAPEAPLGFVNFPYSLSSGNETVAGNLTIQVVVPPAPPPSGLSPGVLAAIAVVAVAAVGGAAYAVVRARRPKAKPRSSTLQRMEMERQVEQAKSVEEKAVLQEQIKAVEVEKSRARDLQILEAKRADVEKMIELLKKRHDAGQLTRHQYEKMVEKKLDELDRIGAEIAAFEAENGSRGGGA